MSTSPNFLFIMTDQQRADHLGCYGNDILKTPNLDQLAERGLTYDRFYVAAPICQPNRATLATGRLPSANGVRQNGIPLSLEATTFIDVLRNAGYRTGLVGKSHLQNVTDILPAERSSRRAHRDPLPPELSSATGEVRTGPRYNCEVVPAWRADPDREIKLPYYGYDQVKLCCSHGDKVEGHYTRWLADRHPDPTSLRGPENALSDNPYSAPQSWRTRMPEELYPTRYVLEESLNFLDGQTSKDEAEPFFLMCSFPDPHHPFTPPGKYWDLYDPDDIELPTSFNNRVDIDNIPVPAIVEAHRGNNETAGDFFPLTVSSKEAREIIALNYGSISMIDNAVGQLVDALDHRGLAENTVVIFTSDHGDYMGDHGLMLKMGLHYQSILRVPFIWSDPEDPAAGERTNRLSGTLDIADTILDRAGLRPYFGMQGHSLLTEGHHRHGIIIEDYGTPVFRDASASAGIQTYVTERWRMSLFEGHVWGELYDLEDDPHELSNRWNDPTYKGIKGEIMGLMAMDQLSLRDRALSPSKQA